MNSENFEFKLLSLYWLENMNEELDLCAHGKLFVKIGDEIICDENTFEITVSSTALYLMRTLEENYKKDDYASQLLPCCGFNFFAENENDDFVNIVGCPSGIDWTITHTDNKKIKHVTEKGNEAELEFEIYKQLVLEFADKIEAFYRKSKQKVIVENDYNKIGYSAFWNEWNTLRKKWK